MLSDCGDECDFGGLSLANVCTQDRKKRVAFLSPVSFFKGGAERSLFDLMDNPSIRPLLIVPEEGALSEEAARRNIQTAVIPFGSVSLIRRPLRVSKVLRALLDWRHAARRLTEVASAHNVDLVHSNGLKAHAVAVLSSRTGGVPCVLHVRDIAHTRVERGIWRALAKSSAHTILVSRACWPGKTMPPNTSVVFNCVRNTELSVAPSSSVEKVIVIGICGRIHPYKGIHLAIEWANAALQRGLQVRLILRGEAAPEDAPYVEHLLSRIRALGLEDDVIFDGQKDGLVAIYEGLDAVLVPSDTPDPLPRSVMEALSLGLPVIGFPAGGIVEMIVPAQTGWLADSEETFCRAVAEIGAFGPQELTEFKSRAAQSVRQHFSPERMFTQLEKIYEKATQYRRHRTS